MKSALVSFLIVVAAVAVVKGTNSSFTTCVSTEFGSDNQSTCLNGAGCCASLNYLITELSSCSYAPATLANKVVIRVESDLELNGTLFITNFCNVSRGFELIGSDMYQYPTIKCHAFGMGLYFGDIQNLYIARLELSKCGFRQYYSNSSDLVKFELHAALYLVHCSNVAIDNVTISSNQGTGAILLNIHGDVTIINSTFEKNEPALVGQSSVANGGGLYIQLGSHTVNQSKSQFMGKYIIQNCFFIRNNHSSQFLLKSSFDASSEHLGKGGGLFISINDNNKYHRLTISNCTFDENSALSGGGIFVQFWNSPQNNAVIIENSHFLKNKCQYAGGGAGASYAFYKDIENDISTAAYNNITFMNCLFEDNFSLGSGGGMHLFSTQANSLSIITNAIKIHNCTLRRNKAYIGSALALAPETHCKGLLPQPILSWCTFSSNFISNETLVKSNAFNASLTGLAMIFISNFLVKIEGDTHIFNNSGTALWLASAEMEIVSGASLNFTRNSGTYGGAIGLFGESMLHIHDKTRLYFISNAAKLRGGAISVESTDFLHKYMFSYNYCFIQYKGNSDNINRDVVFYFEGNEALSGNGNVLFSATVYSCIQTLNKDSPLQIFENIGTVTGPQAIRAPMKDTVRTLPRHFSLELPNSKVSSLEIQPGINFEVNLSATDEYSQHTRVMYQVHILQDTKKADAISVDPAYAFLSNNTILINGIKAMAGARKILILESGRASLHMNILVVDCPPGFVNNDSGTCQCGAAYFNGISNCVSYRAHIVPGYWAGRCAKDQFCTAYCPAGFCNYYGEYRTSSDLLLLPSDIKDLDYSVCGPTRTGILCGKCSLGHSTHYHSYFYGCKSNKLCKLGILFFLISELLPLTVIYTIVMIFNISFTSGKISGFIFFAQIADSLSISASDSIRFPPVIWYFTQAHQFIYRMFNFDFFSIEALSFCLWEGATALDAMIMKYVTILYALGLIIVTILLMKSTRIKRFCTCFRPRALRSAAIHGLTTFIIICFSQCARVSFQIISPAYLYGRGPRKIDTVVQRSGELKPFDETHRKYAIPALFFFSILVILPLLWLLLYPLLFKLLERFKLSESKLAAFLSKLFPMELLDSFQSCFKPNRRYFAGLYFLYRIMTLLVYTATSTLTQFYTLLTLGMILVITVHSIAQPYKVPWHNFLDAFIFANIMAVNALTLYNFHILGVGNDNSSHSVNIALSVQLLLMYLPLVYIVVLIARKIYVEVKRRYPAMECTMSCSALNFEDSTSLPSLRDSVSYHEF